MQELSDQIPGYSWEYNYNIDYPTQLPCQAIEELGILAQHRRSFQPVFKQL